MRAFLLLAGLLLATALASAAGTGDPKPVLDAQIGSERITVALEELAARDGLAPGENFEVVELGRDPNTSHHLVWIRDREVPHRHDRHDLMVVILQGFGRMRIGEDERAVGEGSILYVPRATPHAFRNLSGDPAVAYAIYSPAFDPEDRQPAE